MVGLAGRLEVPERGAAFLWVGDSRRSMLGLWSIGSAPNGHEACTSPSTSRSTICSTRPRLRAHGVTPLSFFGEETTEPSVIGWMPAAAVYFRDPDGHLLEYLAMLDEEPHPERGIVPWSEWVERSGSMRVEVP